MMRWWIALLLLLLLRVDCVARAQERVALLVGNAAYEHGGQLKNPSNDVAAMARALESLGFEVETASNLDEQEMGRALQRFSRSARHADTAVLFYSGHGMEIDGRNYLVPVDARLEHPDDAVFEAIELNKATAAVRAKRLSVVILDACRSNVFPTRDRDMARGFTAITARAGQVVAFSTAAGTIARDGDGDLSPYTQALTESLARAPDRDVRVLFTSLGARVTELAGATQEPFARFGRFGEDTVTLAGHGTEPPTETKAVFSDPAPADPREVILFHQAEKHRSIRLMEEFLSDYPHSTLRAAAEVLLENWRANERSEEKRREQEEARREEAERMAEADRRRAVEEAARRGTGLNPKRAEETRRSEAEAAAEQAWRALEGARDARALETFLKTHGQTRLAAKARAELDTLIEAYREGQRELKRLGLYQGGIDGDWGPRSHRAMQAFQRRVGLSPDGALTDEGLAALKGASPPVNRDEPASLSMEALGITEAERAKITPEHIVEARRACDRGDDFGCAALGLSYLAGAGGLKQDFSRAVGLLRRTCTASLAETCNYLGVLFQRGLGVPRDAGKAVLHFQKACDGYDLWGCYNFAHMLTKGEGADRDLAVAIRLFTWSCTQGLTAACTDLGIALVAGEDFRLDYAEGARLLDVGCKSRDPLACANLGVLHFEALGVERDFAKAVALSRSACDANEPIGCNNLAVAYRDGLGLDRNKAAAIRYFRQALALDPTYDNPRFALRALGEKP